MFELHLTELQSAFAMVAITAGLALLAPLVFRPNNVLHRTLLFVIAIVLSIRYILWRATETLAPFGPTWDCLFTWSLFFLEAAALLSSLSAFTILMRKKDRTPEANNFARWWEPAPTPKVALLIATYNEEKGVLQRTIAGAKALDYENVDVYVLDDGKRDWLRDFCAQQDVLYVCRPDNKGSKAGNINYTLELLKESQEVPDYVAVLDADFVPHRDFLTRCLALFHDDGVGLVQTPQHFFNPDPIQHNLGLSRSYPDEQRFFFDHLQPSRDGWGIAFCCGTSSVVRWRALSDVGGFPTESVTEDFLMTLVLQEKGWRTVYLNEPLTEGLAPEGLKEYVTQRSRWCLGLMQIARSDYGPLSGKALRLRDRWSVIDSMLYWLTSYPFRLAALIYPLFSWYLNATPIYATLPEIVSYFGVYYVWTLFVLNFISGGLVIPLVNDVSQLLGAVPIIRAGWSGLISPSNRAFSVTAKGGDRSKVVIQWRLMSLFLVLLALTLIGMTIGIVSDRFAFNDAGDGKMVLLFWSMYNVVTLSVIITVCIEMPRVEAHIADHPQRTLIRLDDGVHRVWVTDLTEDSVRVRGVVLTMGSQVQIALRNVGEITAFVIESTRDGGWLSLEMTELQYEALLRVLYAQGSAPGVTRTRLRSIIREIVFGSRWR
ncbi:MAG: glycosyltransferase family 2 protein [Allorhizobium sp.]